MKLSNLVKTLFSALIITCFTIGVQAKTVSTTLPADTGKMSKMSKMDKKMEKKKMDKMKKEDKMKKNPDTKM